MKTHTSPESEDELTRLYRETIVQHARQPAGKGKAIRATHKNEQFNHLCGDHIILSLRIENDVVMDAAFEGEACAICTASASLLCGQAAGQTVQEIKNTRSWLDSALHGSEDSREYELLLPLLGVRSYPSRIRCALLPWDALAGAL